MNIVYIIKCRDIRIKIDLSVLAHISIVKKYPEDLNPNPEHYRALHSSLQFFISSTGAPASNHSRNEPVIVHFIYR